MQNSGATKQISPVRRQTTVGVPLKEINLSSSCKIHVSYYSFLKNLETQHVREVSSENISLQISHHQEREAFAKR